jgi:hypothetical protein
MICVCMRYPELYSTPCSWACVGSSTAMKKLKVGDYVKITSGKHQSSEGVIDRETKCLYYIEIILMDGGQPVVVIVHVGKNNVKGIEVIPDFLSTTTCVILPADEIRRIAGMVG